jgi:2-(1,2-epoxy-1,2-dihydrophenyl)acetyl-CoA isomerase
MGRMAPLVQHAVKDGVALIEINRPEASNAFDMPTAQAFHDAVDRVADPAVGAVLVTGAGPRFCAGGDISSFISATDRAAYLEELAIALDGALQMLAGLDKPVVACVQGAVAGAGLALMLSCDITVAAETTRFVTAYSGVGLTPDCGLSYLLPRAVGQTRALEMLLTGRRLTAAEALDWGLVTEVREDTDARARAGQLARELAKGPSFALGQAKRLARGTWEMSRERVGPEEARVIARAVVHPDAESRISAFVKR